MLLSPGPLLLDLKNVTFQLCVSLLDLSGAEESLAVLYRNLIAEMNRSNIM